MYKIDYDKGELEFRVPKDASAGYINNQRELYNFTFNGMLDEKATQEQVFEVVARQMVDNALQGLNGTVFAYGQTGSGKTYTITGGAERYEDRGLIPRTLQALFGEIEKQRDRQFEVRISYMEIYNESGYDLLDPNHESKKLEDLPKVMMHSDDHDAVRFHNLGELQVQTAEQALELLFVGDTNRIVCETPSNDVSTRSHCLFTINLESKELGGTKIRRSKARCFC